MGYKDVCAELLESEPCRSVLMTLGKRARLRTLFNGLSGHRAVFDSFEEAWSAAPKFKHYVGHDNLASVALHFSLSKGLRPSDYAVLYWLCNIARQSGFLRLLDWGGNAGNLYYSYLPYLDICAIDLLWTVFDFPAIMLEGERVTSERHADRLHFISKPMDADNINVVLFSGSLHYCEDLDRTLEEIASFGDHVIANRIPILESAPQYITLQQTDHITVPCVVRNWADLTREFERHGYEITDRWPSSELRLLMPLFPCLSVRSYSGFYCHKTVKHCRSQRMPKLPCGL